MQGQAGVQRTEKLAWATETVSKAIQDTYDADVRGYTTSAQIASGILDMIPYAVEIALTSGTAAGIRAGVKATARSLLRKDAKGKIGRAVAGLASTAAIAAMQGGTIGAPKVLSGTLRRQIGTVAYDENGVPRSVNGEPLMKAFGKALGDTFIEYFTEQTGRAITGGAKAAIAKIPGAKKYLSRVAEAFRKVVPEGGRSAELLNRMEYSSLAGEMGEEEFGRVLKSVTGINDIPIVKALFPGWEQLFVEASVLSVPGAAGMAGRIIGREGQQQAEATPPRAPLQPVQQSAGVAQGRVPSRYALAPGGFTGEVQSSETAPQPAPIQTPVKPSEAPPQPVSAPIAEKRPNAPAEQEKAAKLTPEERSRLDDLLSRRKNDDLDELSERKALLSRREPIATGQPYESRVYRGESPLTPVDEGAYGKGTYFTQEREYAEGYGGGTAREMEAAGLAVPEADKGGRVIATHVHLDNPFVVTDPARLRHLIGPVPREWKSLSDSEIANRESQSIHSILKQRGHDGIVIRWTPFSTDEVVVFDPAHSVEGYAKQGTGYTFAQKPSEAPPQPVSAPIVEKPTPRPSKSEKVAKKAVEAPKAAPVAAKSATIEGNPPAKAEKSAITDYLAQFADPTKSVRSGKLVTGPPYLSGRNEKAADELSSIAKSGESALPVPEHLQKIGAIGLPESADNAIAVGEAYGYKPEDIAYYLIRNYTPTGKAFLDGKSGTTGAPWADKALMKFNKPNHVPAAGKKVEGKQKPTFQERLQSDLAAIHDRPKLTPENYKKYKAEIAPLEAKAKALGEKVARAKKKFGTTAAEKRHVSLIRRMNAIYEERLAEQEADHVVEANKKIEGKQPWEMTRAEVATAEVGKPFTTGSTSDPALAAQRGQLVKVAKVTPKGVKFDDGKFLAFGKFPPTFKHSETVRKAVAANKPVTAAVLQAYKTEPWAKKALAKLKENTHAKTKKSNSSVTVSTDNGTSATGSTTGMANATGRGNDLAGRYILNGVAVDKFGVPIGQAYFGKGKDAITAQYERKMDAQKILRNKKLRNDFVIIPRLRGSKRQYAIVKRSSQERALLELTPATVQPQLKENTHAKHIQETEALHGNVSQPGGPETAAGTRRETGTGTGGEGVREGGQAAEEVGKAEGAAQLKHAEESVAKAITNAPSWGKLRKAIKAHERSLNKFATSRIDAEMQKIDEKPWRALSRHAGVMNAKSARAKTLHRLAMAVIEESGVQVVGQNPNWHKQWGKVRPFRGDSEAIDWKRVIAAQSKPEPSRKTGQVEAKPAAPEPAKPKAEGKVVEALAPLDYRVVRRGKSLGANPDTSQWYVVQAKGHSGKWQDQVSFDDATPESLAGLKEWLTSRNINPNDVSIQKAKSKPAKPTAPEGKAESGPAPQTILVEREPTPESLRRKPVSTEDVVNVLADAFSVPIRTGRFRRRKAGGIFKPDWRIVRTKRFGDIGTSAHEVAHALWHDVDLRKQLKGNKPVLQELRGLDYEPKKRRANEGFSEFVRIYLTTDTSSEVAPETHKWFTEQWLPKSNYVEAFARSRKAVDQWRQQGSLRRVAAQVDKERGRFKNVRDIASAANLGRNLRLARGWILSRFINRLQPLVDAQAAITGTTKLDEIPGKYQFATFAKVASMAAGAKARQMVMTGMTDVAGNRLGAGLQEILAPIAAELRDPDSQLAFESYMYARHALDVIAAGKNPGITAADAKVTVKEYGDLPGWEKAADGVTKWHNGLLDYLMSAGGLTSEAKEKMRSLYPHYVPLMRSIQTDNMQAGSGAGGRKIADLPQGVKRLKGSGRRIVSPLESSIMYAERIVALADKVRLGNMIVNAAEKYKGMGEIVEPVSPNMIPISAALKSIAGQLDEAGVDLQEADMDAAITIFQNLYRSDAKDNIIILWRGGKRKLYQVAPDVYRSMMAIDEQFQLPKVLDWIVGLPTRAVRLGATGLRPAFSMLTNPMRDVQTAVVQTRIKGKRATLPSVAYRSMAAIADDIGGAEIARMFKAGGGEMSQPLAIDRRFSQEALNEVLATTPKSKALNWMDHPVDGLRKLFSVTELGPRLAEYEAILRSMGWKPGQRVTFGQYITAQAAAADVTVDFREGGSLSMKINRGVAFFNAQVQGPNRFVQAMRKRPIATFLKVVANITLPSLALWWFYKDDDWYNDLPVWEKARYWHVKIGKAIIRVPKPFEAGMIFGSMIAAMAESLYQRDPTALKESAREWIGSIVPPYVPTAAEPAIEVVANKDFFRNAPIVSKGLENLRPEDQYGPHTSETARKMGKLFGLAPAKIDHLIEGYTGGLGRDVISAGESVMRGIGVLPKKGQAPMMLKDMPVIGRLFVRETTTRVFDDFYNKLAELNMNAASANAGRAEPLSKKDDALRNRMAKASRLLSSQRKVMRELLASDTPDARKMKQMLAIHRRMKKIAVASVTGPIFKAVTPQDRDELKAAYVELKEAEAFGRTIDSKWQSNVDNAMKSSLSKKVREKIKAAAEGTVKTDLMKDFHRVLGKDKAAALHYAQARLKLGYGKKGAKKPREDWKNKEIARINALYKIDGVLVTDAEKQRLIKAAIVAIYDK